MRAHFFDYPPAAAACWAAITLAGLVAAVWAVAHLAAQPEQWPLSLLAVAVAALASSHPVRIPRSKFSLSTADLCTYVALITLGPAAAVLSAGADGALGAWRATQRLSSRIATPTSAMAATALAGLAHGHTEQALIGLLGAAGAALGALGVAALVVFVGTTLPLTSMMTLKRGRALSLVSLRDWITHYGWVGAMMQATALAAGLVVLNARLFGAGLIAAVGVLIAVSVALLRTSLARQEAEQAAQEAQLESARREAGANQQRFMAAFTHAAVGMAIVGQDQRTLQVNLSLAQLLGAAEADLVGQPFHRFLHAGDVPLLERLMRDVADRPDQTFSVQLRCSRFNGDEVWVALHCSRFQDPGPSAADATPEVSPAAAGAERRCVIYQLHDITSRHLAEQRLQHIAYHDSLTDLANRACFVERLALAVARKREQPEADFAVLFLDLDRFKVVNDSLGHQAGNELLCAVAERLRASVRPRDLVARLGGDEFAVLCETLAEPAHAHQVAARIGAALTQPLQVRGTEVVPGVSIGITLSDLSARSADDVLRDADLAMYEAKAAGRGRVAVFDASMHERIADRLVLEADLRRAIGEGKLSAAFQPIFELGQRQLVGFEALARWEHPTRGPVPPSVFIKLAEESGHIAGVTRWIIDHAASQLAMWRRDDALHERLSVNVNISGRDLGDPTLVDFVRGVLERHGLPARALTLEITETTLMGHLDIALASLEALRELGVRFSIDDFGTGYSSLAYLSTLPFDSLKIDRSFINGMAQGAQNIEIVRTVLHLGHTLGKVVVAEGVETAEQLQQLQRLGVDCAQGYLLSRPLAATAARELLLLSMAPAQEALA